MSDENVTMVDETTETAAPAPVTETVENAKKFKLSLAPEGKSSVLKFDPFDVLIDENLRGRHTPPSDEQVTQLAMSFYALGQIDPITIHLNREGKPVATAGFTRLEAARLLRKGFRVDVDTVDDETGKEVTVKKDVKDESFLISCLLTKESSDEAFVRNVVSNAHRNQTTIIDDAHNQERLRQQPYGYTDRKIANMYGITPARVSQLKKYLDMPEHVQNMIHNGRISANYADMLMQLPDDERARIIDSVLAGIHVPAAKVRGKLRNYLANRPEVHAAESTAPTEDNGTAAPTEDNGTAAPDTAPEKPKRGRPAVDGGQGGDRLTVHDVMLELKLLRTENVHAVCPQLQEIASIFYQLYQGSKDRHAAWSLLGKVFGVTLPDPDDVSTDPNNNFGG